MRAALDALGEEVLAGGTLRDALREMLRRGLPDDHGGLNRQGLDDLRARAARMRREAARRGRLDGTVARTAARLDQAVAAERDALAPLASDRARFAEARLDALPRSPAAAVRELADYEWTSPSAERLYRQILDELRTDVLDHQFRGLRDALTGVGPDAPQGRRRAANDRLTEMLADLNQLLAEHVRGEDTREHFGQFMQRHGDLFPEQPADVEELIDTLARQAAAAERLMASLSPQQHEELAGLVSAALDDPALATQMSALTDNLRALRPELRWDRGERTQGASTLGYGGAAGALAEIADLDGLIDQLGQEHPGATLDDIDVEAVQRSLGRAAAQEVRDLQRLERELGRQGWLVRGEQGLQLSPKALRRLGQTALRRVFEHLAARGRGEHDLRDAGAAGEITGASRGWQFGDEQPLDVVRTVNNAVLRSAARSPLTTRDAGSPPAHEAVPALPGTRSVRLTVEDFEVAETERQSSAAVALCVDLSYSMVAEGRWGPMKQTGLALAHLVATRFPQDSLQIIGFGRYAGQLSLEELAAVEPDYVQGTNLQHALHLAGRHVRRHRSSEPVVLVVTDGEPTAHLDAGGVALFAWPPTPATVEATITEVDGLTRFGAAINVFMLGEDAGLRRFVDAMARRNGGRVFTPAADRLDQYVVSDYLRARRGRRART